MELPAPIEIPEKKYHSKTERNQKVLNGYIEGIEVSQLATEFQISVARVYAIIKANKAEAILDRDFEKSRRIIRLKRTESKAPENLAPENTDQLVRILEAQRKELEGDSQSSVTNNTQINISVDINAKSQSELWEMARKLLG